MKKIPLIISCGVIFCSCSVLKKFRVRKSRNIDSVSTKSSDSCSSKLNSESNYKLDSTEDSSSTKKKITNDFIINFDDIDTSTGRKYFYKIGNEEIESPRKIKSLVVHNELENDSSSSTRTIKDTGSLKVASSVISVSKKDSISKHEVTSTVTESKTRFSFEWWWLILIAGLATVCYFFYKEEKNIL